MLASSQCTCHFENCDVEGTWPLSRSPCAFPAGSPARGSFASRCCALEVTQCTAQTVRCCGGRRGEGCWGQGLRVLSRRPQRLPCSRGTGTVVTALLLPVAPTPARQTPRCRPRFSRWQHSPYVLPVPFKKLRWRLLTSLPKYIPSWWQWHEAVGGGA